MGIGNDIKPKKVYRYKKRHHGPSVPPIEMESGLEESEKDELSKKIAAEHAPEEKEDLEDDFFHDYNKNKPNARKEKDSGGFLFQNLNAKNITWLLLIALVVIVIYQNFDSIKALVIKNDKLSDNNNTNNEYYEGTATNSNLNVNENINTNLNNNANTNATTIDKTAITLKVLNGNGISGSADAVAATLKTAGFGPAKSSNARKFTYPASIIYYKTGKEAEANLVKDALPDLETTVENSDSIVGTYDIIVVVGKK